MPSWRAFCGPKPPWNRESFWAAGIIFRRPWGVRRPSWRAFCGPKPPRNGESFWAAGNISRGPWGVSLGLGCGKKVCGPPKNSAARAEAHPWWAAGKIPHGLPPSSRCCRCSCCFVFCSRGRGVFARAVDFLRRPRTKFSAAHRGQARAADLFARAVDVFYAATQPDPAWGSLPPGPRRILARPQRGGSPARQLSMQRGGGSQKSPNPVFFFSPHREHAKSAASKKVRP